MKWMLTGLLTLTALLTAAQDNPDQIQTLLTSRKWTLTQKRSAMGGKYNADNINRMALTFSRNGTGQIEDLNFRDQVISTTRFNWKIGTGYDKEPLLTILPVTGGGFSKNADNFISGPLTTSNNPASQTSPAVQVSVRAVRGKGDIQLRFTPMQKTDGTVTHYLFN